jgi:DNA-binding response OmpR family regulator
MIQCKAALLVSAADEDYQALGDLFSQQGWTLYQTTTLNAAVAFVCKNPVPVLITERDLPLGNWKDLFAAMLQLPRAPLFIVTSRLADEHLWAELLNLGGHDVLCKPLQTKEVLWVLHSAWALAKRHELEMHGTENGQLSNVRAWHEENEE